MRWQGRRQSSNVEDRRGMGGGMGGGFGRLGGGFGFPGGMGRGRIPIGMGGGRGGIGGLVLVLLVLGAIYLFSNGGGSGLFGTDSSSVPPPDASQDQLAAFAKTIFADTEDTWTDIFSANGQTYRKPTLVLFNGSTYSGCGTATEQVGPFYCPVDQKVYIDLAFYEELRSRFSAPGDFAEAYVLAHEVGHHVQNLLGLLEPGSDTGAGSQSVRTELQADCFAGVWAHDAERRGYLEPGDIDEALNAASQIGDDTIQRRMQGYVVPDTFTHGTAAQRNHWFRQGYESGDPGGCDTSGQI
jgi:predicted metalloprotease